MFSVVIIACATDPSAEPSAGRASPQSSNDATESSLGADGALIPGGCPCGGLQNPLRATVTGLREESVRLRVEEFFGAAGDLQVGSEIEGTWGGSLPCFVGSAAAVEPGSEVLAFYFPPFACPSPDGCELGPVIPGRIALTAWGETMVLVDGTRGEVTISVEEVALLNAPVEDCRAALGNAADVIGPEDDIP
jgi:hypothetical protein